MTRQFTITILAISFSIFTYGQATTKSCSCPKNNYTGTEADTIFYLTNGKKISLCGYKNPGSKPVNYSEFVLAVCGEDKVIDFWDGTQTCYLRTKKDTLLIDNLVNLPTGKNRIYELTIWAREKIFFKGPVITKVYAVNRNIPKYDQKDIAQTIQEFETAKAGLSEEKMELANRLFIAAISGNLKAREYFKEFSTKFGNLDGAFSEEYSDLTAMLNLWDK